MTNSYQPQALAPQFQAREIISQGAFASQQADDLQRQLELFQGQLAQRAQNRLEDQQFYGKELEAFSEFSQTALNFAKDRFKQAAKDKDIGAQYATLYNQDVIIPEETQAIIDAQVQEATLGAMARRIESEGAIAAAEELRKRNGLGAGVTNERALLLDARSKYMPEMTKLLNGPLAEMYNSDPGAAIDIANRIFIEKYNLQYTTKANFVEILGETMRNQSSMLGVNKESELIEERKKNTLLENDRAIIGSLAELTPVNSTQRFQELSDQIYRDNNGINTRAGANARVAQQWLVFASSNGNEALFNNVGATPVIPGNPGTTIANTYPALFFEQNQALQQAQEANRARQRAQILRITGERLMAAGSPEESRSIVEDSIQELGGDIEGQRQLQELYGGYGTNPQAYIEEDRLRQQILTQPESVTEQDLRIKLRNNEISAAGFRGLLTDLNSFKKPVMDEVPGVRNNVGLRFTEQLKLQTGATQDPQGLLSSIKNPQISTPQLNVINRAFREYINDQLETYAETLSPTLTRGEINEKLTMKANEIFQKETEAGGRFYFNGLFDGETLETKARKNKQDFQAIIDSIKAWNGGVALAPNPSRGNTNWTTQWSLRQGGKNLAKVYKPGDILFTKEEVEERLNNPSHSIYPVDLAVLAQQLKQTPQQLLIDSGSPHNIIITPFGDKEIKDLLSERKNDQFDHPLRDQPGIGGNYDDTMSRLLPAFMSHGLSYDGAAVAASVVRYFAAKNGRDITKETGFIDTMMQQLYDYGVLGDLKNPNLTLKQMVYAISKTGLANRLDWNGYAKYYKDKFAKRYQTL